MSEENDNVDTESEGVKSLRKQYDTIKKQNDELAAELNKFRAEKRTSTVADLLKAKGVPESAASLYTNDDVSEDAVGKWVESYADVFGLGQQNGSNSSADLNDMRRVSNASHGNADSTALDEVGHILGDPAELERAMQTLPFEELVKRGYIGKG